MPAAHATFARPRPDVRYRLHTYKTAAADTARRFQYGTPRSQRPFGPLISASEPADAFALASELFAPGPAQNPVEILGFIDHARASRPQVICEIGTQDSGNLFLLSSLLTSVGFCVGVDREFRNTWLVAGLLRRRVRFSFVRGSSQTRLTFGRVRDTLGGRPVDLLFIDGDHSLAGASRDFLNYRALVRPGGLIAFHDIVPDEFLRTGRRSGAYAGDVPRLWSSVKPGYEHREFIADPDQDGRGIGCLVHDPSVPVPDELLVAARS
ncbi:MAG: class I SAM-dependent methyltransferase [Solirubrobacteraceae bacterium]|jgi:hypothetical protein